MKQKVVICMVFYGFLLGNYAVFVQFMFLTLFNKSVLVFNRAEQNRARNKEFLP